MTFNRHSIKIWYTLFFSSIFISTNTKYRMSVTFYIMQMNIELPIGLLARPQPTDSADINMLWIKKKNLISIILNNRASIRRMENAINKFKHTIYNSARRIFRIYKLLLLYSSNKLMANEDRFNGVLIIARKADFLITFPYDFDCYFIIFHADTRRSNANGNRGKTVVIAQVIWSASKAFRSFMCAFVGPHRLSGSSAATFDAFRSNQHIRYYSSSSLFACDVSSNSIVCA